MCGVKAYDPILMFKIIMIQKFYNLSDEKTEQSLNTNLLYMRFAGLSLEDLAPDSTIKRCINRCNFINIK